MINSKAFDALSGNERLKALFSELIEKSAVPHSVIISGPEGSGKNTLAKILTMALACGAELKPCAKCEACRKISEGISPDITYIKPLKDRKTIGVEAVRNIRDSVYIAPNDLDVRVYIINGAELMTVQAQNALLKLFEEPPVGVYFILLCASATGLLSTVRSRAPEFKTEIFTDEKITDLLLNNSGRAKDLYNSDMKSFRQILRLSAGSYGKALSLIKDKAGNSAPVFSKTEEYLSLLSGASRADFLVAATAVCKSREEMTGFGLMLLSALRDMLAVRKSGTPDLCFFSSHEDARGFARKFTVKALADIYLAAEKSEAEISDTNINLQTAGLVMADRLWKAKN